MPLYAVYSPQVTERMDDRALFDVMSAMLAHLKDGHVDLRTPFAYFNSANRKPLKTLDMELVKRDYLSSGFQTAGYGNFTFTYGQMSAEIGYIHIASFSSRTGRSWVDKIDPIVDRFSENKGLIIDVRNNPGGDSEKCGSNSRTICRPEAGVLTSAGTPRTGSFGLQPASGIARRAGWCQTIH